MNQNNMERKIKCRKCQREFMTPEIICTKRNYVIKGTKIPATFVRTNRTCKLCRNIGKAFTFKNKEMN